MKNFLTAWRSGQTEFVLHTSGSTGQPKAITLTRAQMQASATLTGKTFGLLPGNRALVCLNTDYVAGTMMLVRGEVLGLDLVIVEPVSNPLTGFSADEPFDFAAFVPLQLQTILADLDPATGLPAKLPILNRVKAILIGGAATSPALEQALQVIAAPVFATYGMTETVSHIAIRRLNGPDAVDYFTALSGVELAVDERGCLNIRAAATNFNLVQTNDVVEFLDAPTDGLPGETTPGPTARKFRLLGRADSVINSGGVKIQPEAVERVIQQTLAGLGTSPLPRFFVAGLPDERLGQRVTMFIEQLSMNNHQSSMSNNDFEQLLTANWSLVIELVGPYAVPKEVIFVPKFIETPTGKIDRKATLELVKN
jgi:o-succinylbenzoate---CoA ligase